MSIAENAMYSCRKLSTKKCGVVLIGMTHMEVLMRGISLVQKLLSVWESIPDAA